MTAFTIEFKNITNQDTKLTKAYATKKEAKKLIKDLLKSGRIILRGYDYFTTTMNFELRLNF